MNDVTQNMLPVVILGAGIAGLAAAKTLGAAGVDAVVVDKARGVGGRMATRRLSEGQCDHGAQYFTARTEEFRAEVTAWCRNGWASPWTTRGDSVRYVGTPAMTAVAKGLAQKTSLQLEKRVVALSPADSECWHIDCEGGSRLTAKKVLSTLPAPQLLACLDAGATRLAQGDREALAGIVYAPTFALLLRFGEDQPRLPEAAIENGGEPFSWIANNQGKGVSRSNSVTAHTTAAFSRTHLEAPLEETAALLVKAMGRWIGAPVLEQQLHRWRYARVERGLPHTFLRLAGLPPLLCAGDAFGDGGRVETAWLSGNAAARELLERR